MDNRLFLLTLLVYASACSAGAGDSGADVHTSVVAAALTSNVALNKSCDSKNDGWRPAAIPVATAVQSNIDKGDPAIIHAPEGYQHMPAKGTPYCEKRVRGDFWAVRCDTDADCPTGSLCPFDHADAKCEATCSSDADCSGGALCRKRGDKPSKLCVCAAPNWCDDPPVDM